MRRTSYPEEDGRKRRDEDVDDQDDGTQVVRKRTGEEDEEDVAEEDARDHTMEELDEDDLANMQGPDA